MLTALPVDAFVPEIRRLLRAGRFLVVTAPPGAGKTTRIPPALAEDGRVICLQPRRVAARSLVRRIASERGWGVGDEVGWQIRFERRFTPRTRLLIATEGILTARLQSDPLLSEFSTVVLDEFHERSIYADLALALAKQAAAARDDLRVVVMSATLDARSVSEYLGGCPIVDVPGRLHPVDVEYAPDVRIADAASDAIARAEGHVLCFLPGAREIRDAASELRARLAGVAVHELHGGLDVDAQEAALAPSLSPKVILATNIAETSLTVEGVTTVIDSGVQRVVRYDRGTGIDRLVTERVSRDSADQRAGRAGRVAPGRAVRLWDRRDILDEHREPEIHRVDLASLLLDVIGWGDDPKSFDWYEAPDNERIDADLALLERLGALEYGRLTAIGHLLQRLPLHPRLGRVLIAAGGSRDAARACVALSEAGRWNPRIDESSDSDVQSLVDRFGAAPPNLRAAAEEIETLARQAGIHRRASMPLRRALLAGFPDRVARRREPGSPRVVLASGHGAVLARESGVRSGEFLVALDVGGGDRGQSAEALVRMASVVEKEWLSPTRIEVAHRFDDATGSVRAVEIGWYDSIVLAERPARPDPELAEEMLVAAFRSRGMGEHAEAVLRRLRFAGIEPDLDAIIREACAGRSSLPKIDLEAAIPYAARRELDRLSPETITVPSGRSVRLEYRDDGEVMASVKLQELFGLSDTPRIGPRSTPVTFALLSPSGRPVQVTRDLHSFWATTYQEVRRELRGRYPKHPWPEDPWTAVATARTKRRS